MSDASYVVAAPFADGERYIPQWQAELFREYKIPTWELTYMVAVDHLNLHNTRNVINAHADRLINEHLKVHGQ